jgi:hypothetical protein
MPVGNPTLIEAMEAELERVRVSIDELGAYADTLRTLLAQAHGESSTTNGATARKRTAARKRSATEKAVGAEKLEALHGYLRRTIPTGQAFTSGDLEGWQGFEELGLRGGRVAGALKQLSEDGRVRQVDRSEYQGELSGRRTKVWKLNE